jgi:hypothetical protein
MLTLIALIGLGFLAFAFLSAGAGAATGRAVVWIRRTLGRSS